MCVCCGNGEGKESLRCRQSGLINFVPPVLMWKQFATSRGFITVFAVNKGQPLPTFPDHSNQQLSRFSHLFHFLSPQQTVYLCHLHYSSFFLYSLSSLHVFNYFPSPLITFLDNLNLSLSSSPGFITSLLSSNRSFD